MSDYPKFVKIPHTLFNELGFAPASKSFFRAGLISSEDSISTQYAIALAPSWVMTRVRARVGMRVRVRVGMRVRVRAD